MTLERDGYEAARDAAQLLVLENLDSYFNLAFLSEEYGDSFLALLSSRECVRLYLKYFPEKFDWQKSKLWYSRIEEKPVQSVLARR